MQLKNIARAIQVSGRERVLPWIWESSSSIATLISLMWPLSSGERGERREKHHFGGVHRVIPGAKTFDILAGLCPSSMM